MIHFASNSDEIAMRELVIQYAETHGLCKDGVNEFLDEVGLPLWEQHHKVEVTMTVIVHEDDSDNLQVKLEDAVGSMNWDHENNAVIGYSERTITYEAEV